MKASELFGFTIPQGAAGRIDPVCRHFEREWLAGKKPRIEDSLPLVEAEDRPYLFMELLGVELDNRRRAGEVVTAEEFQQRFPEYLEYLDRVFDSTFTQTSQHRSNDVHPQHQSAYDGFTSALLPTGLQQPTAALPPISNSSSSLDTEDEFAFLNPPQKPGEIGRLGHYRILKLLGKGGMGMVFHAEDIYLRRSVALKVMNPSVVSTAMRQRFLRRGEILCSSRTRQHCRDSSGRSRTRHSLSGDAAAQRRISRGRSSAQDPWRWTKFCASAGR